MRAGRISWKNLLSAGILIATLILTKQLIVLAKHKQELRTDLAEINHVSYGLLNEKEWTNQISSILAGEIVSYISNPENRGEILTNLSAVLYRIFDEVEQLTNESYPDFLRDSIPAFASRVLDELNRPASKLILRGYVIDKLGNISLAPGTLEHLGTLHQLLLKYDSDSKNEGRKVIQLQLDKKQGAINGRVIFILVLTLAIFLLNVLSATRPDPIQSALIIASLFLLLLGGIGTPMIELEAKIDLLQFHMLGRDILFKDNIVFFQSKSITDMVEILMKEGSVEMIFVGTLIFLFSIIFPSAKLISSFIFSLNHSRLKNNKIIEFFVLKSGKWSMADVIVVAIFMAYVAFDGSLNILPEHPVRTSELVEVFTTKGTRLLGGFYLFLFFCLFSLAFSELLSRDSSASR